MEDPEQPDEECPRKEVLCEEQDDQESSRRRLPSDEEPVERRPEVELLERLHKDVEAAFRKHERELQQLLQQSGRPLVPRSEDCNGDPGILLSGMPSASPTHTSKYSKHSKQSRQPSEISRELVRSGSTSYAHWNRALRRQSQHVPSLTTRLKMRVGLPEAPIVAPHSKLRWLAQTVQYNALRCAVIVLDAVLVVWELESASKVAMSSGRGVSGGIQDNTGFVVFTDLCFLYLLADLVLHLILEYPQVDLLLGRTGYRWFNLLALLEQMLQMIGHHQFRDKRSLSSFRVTVSQFSVLRVVRLLIVLPEIGLMRKQQFMGDLRVMIRSLTGALPPLFWCSATVFVILVTFGIFFSECALAYLIQSDSMTDASMDELKENFGTLFSSWLSLYSAIFGGVDWSDLYKSLGPLSPQVKFCFLSFICFTFVALMNVVTAVFIKCAFVRSENDRDFMIQKELDSKRDFLDTMRQIFAELDEDGNGRIGFEELAGHLEDPGVGAYFSKLGVDANEVEKLFALLDEDRSGSIDKEEFMFGCLRLKGEAKSLDLAILHQEVKLCSESLTDVRASFEGRLEEFELTMNHQAQDLWRLHQDMTQVASDFQEVRRAMDDLQSFSKNLHGWILEAVDLTAQQPQSEEEDSEQQCEEESLGGHCQL